MTITLKDLKIHRGLSEETTAFDTKVLFDGKLIGHAYCRGCGDDAVFNGPFVEQSPAAQAWVVLQPDLIGRSVAREPWAIELRRQRGQPAIDAATINHPDIGSYVDELVERELSARDARKFYRRMAKTGSCSAYVTGGFVSTSGDGPKAREAVLKKYPEAIILSGLSEDEAAQVPFNALYPV